jgi:hypothetical protein
MGTASPTIGSDVVGNYQSVLIAHWVAAPGTRSIPLSHRLTRPTAALLRPARTRRPGIVKLSRARPLLPRTYAVDPTTFGRLLYNGA